MAEFASGMTRERAEELGKQMLRLHNCLNECRDHFLIFDINHDGYIQASEMLFTLETFGQVCARMIGPGAHSDRATIVSLFNHMSGGSDGITFRQFVHIWLAQTSCHPNTDWCSAPSVHSWNCTEKGSKCSRLRRPGARKTQWRERWRQYNSATLGSQLQS
eukprot:TRINITY_DN18601_c0_g1_i1.p1 TRINITY_DN18601_c0_g1~~TRINITY_DN18601_c0_g1_i1.p1  ORF type:complete len:161 (+),score=25.04 TRINITY_DN18601_c0_g1_i1:101-583(+)